MNILLVFCLSFGDKHLTFSRENKQRHEATLEFLRQWEKVLSRLELGALFLTSVLHFLEKVNIDEITMECF